MRVGVISVESDQHFISVLAKHNHEPFFVYFKAKWCRPCVSALPQYEQTASNFLLLPFSVVDVDLCPDTAMRYGARAIPYIVVIKNGSVVESMTGYDAAKINALAKKYSDQTALHNTNRAKRGQAYPSVQFLKEQTDPTSVECRQTVLRILDNVISNPLNMKYRSVGLESETFKNKIAVVLGAIEVLFDVGFNELDNRLVLPTDADLETVLCIRDALAMKERNQETGARPDVSFLFPKRIGYDPQQSQGFTINQHVFVQKIINNHSSVCQHESPTLHAKILSVMPIEKIRRDASALVTGQEEPRQQSHQKPPFEEMVVLLIVKWFKEFFRWFQNAECIPCGKSMALHSKDLPNPEELKWKCSMVEVFRCPQCSAVERFPRYNDPEKLLETRKGRCGEFANLLTACVRAAGYETRMVVDWTDHVWTEVYLECYKRWVHCDSGESKLDEPLLYESGWGKKLTYVVAFSPYEIVDVTWKYTSKPLEVLSRRREVSERFAISTMLLVTSQIQAQLSKEKKNLYRSRFVRELVEFLSVRTANEGALQGRITGDELWRSVRGESGASADEGRAYALKPLSFYATSLKITYSSAPDTYQIKEKVPAEDCRETTLAGFLECCHTSFGIFRKVEHDHMMVYLSRKTDVDVGIISWKFECLPGQYFAKVSLLVNSTTFGGKGAKVEWCVTLPSNTSEPLLPGLTTDVPSLCGETSFVLRAKLTGGEGSLAWQHAQLFRCNLDDGSPGMCVDINFSQKPDTEHNQ